ncbi:MAG: hypothetical protein GW848_07190 [Rhodoferax sp.]|nr:hypothetical protein [Rhodoferax sp.]OIP24502.1 MAG: hypothetical protein AUK52_02115 [Comamonadaceae bacterium CG2_30_60_41]PIW08618.1 MAG: hypothetical protein COW39_09070 [Comamonadaceae bacterium CG17_big_fil_post_rev_8_21_14_2_50_60_13]PIY26056.1 MAG: hypothetical protein COZ10_03530 [Comamonadaceae bacterium CG_4_10_14_3_um_filter_60_75]PJC11804.1 MAG: hypothetical protein CO066_13680 [Comamonadaceae bacterium CG_4_9_14_0_8_um_filter_60_18]
MQAFRWDHCFLTGRPTVDQQHHYLVTSTISWVRHSASRGVVALKPSMTNAEALLKAADQGLYLSKERGRNCVSSILG